MTNQSCAVARQGCSLCRAHRCSYFLSRNGRHKLFLENKTNREMIPFVEIIIDNTEVPNRLTACLSPPFPKGSTAPMSRNG